MEVSLSGEIVQCRGFRNNMGVGSTPKPQEMIDFETEYQAYLDSLFRKMEKTAGKGMKQAV